MYKLLFVILVLLNFSIPVFVSADENASIPLVETSSEICKKLKEDNKEKSKEYAQRGCCSWHSGVCGCSSGRVVCCDGSKSPSCLCNKEQSPEIIN